MDRTQLMKMICEFYLEPKTREEFINQQARSRKGYSEAVLVDLMVIMSSMKLIHRRGRHWKTTEAGEKFLQDFS